jgi:hypothetical protein
MSGLTSTLHHSTGNEDSIHYAFTCSYIPAVQHVSMLQYTIICTTAYSSYNYTYLSAKHRCTSMFKYEQSYRNNSMV